jgi:phosphorylcholine metabolism protein LicD
MCFVSRDPCFLDAKARSKLVYMVHAFDDIMTELNISHWIDYGTLLGALRYEDVIPWDHDADVGFADEHHYMIDNDSHGHNLAKKRYNMLLNAAIMEYDGLSVDVFAWKKVSKQLNASSPVLTDMRTRAYNRWAYLEDFHDFEDSLLRNLTRIKFAGKMVVAPNRPENFVKKRYPFSYTRSIPFKVSCYMPWNWPKLLETMSMEKVVQWNSAS